MGCFVHIGSGMEWRAVGSAKVFTRSADRVGVDQMVGVPANFSCGRDFMIETENVSDSEALTFIPSGSFPYDRGAVSETCHGFWLGRFVIKTIRMRFGYLAGE